MRKLYLLIFGLFPLLFHSCSKDETKNAPSERKIGKYIYEDDNAVYHIDDYCIRLRHGKDENGHEIYGKHPIDTSDFKIIDKQYFRVCVRCVNDKEYEHMLKMSDRNTTYEDE